MTLKAYYDNIKAKTGKTPGDFKALAEKKGLLKPGVKTGEIVTWLKEDYGLGRGHAMAIVLALKQATSPKTTADSRIDKLFGGSKTRWRKTYDGLFGKASKFGSDVTVAQVLKELPLPGSWGGWFCVSWSYTVHRSVMSTCQETKSTARW